MDPFVSLASAELRKQRAVKFNLDLTYTGHFREGSNLFENLLAMFYAINQSAAWLTCTFFLYNYEVSQKS